MSRSFDGTNDSVDFGTTALFHQIGNLSWAFWLKLTGSPDDFDMYVTIEGGVGETEAENATFFLDSSSVRRIRYIHERGAGLNEAYTFSPGGPTLNTNQWYHLIWSRDVAANTVVGYVNNGGSPYDTFNYTNDPTNTGTTMNYRLGERSDGNWDLSNAKIAATVYSNVVWTAAERTAVYENRVLTGASRGLLHYASFMTDEGSTEPDLSGNSNHGTIVGAAFDADNPPIPLPDVEPADLFWFMPIIDAR